MEHRLLLYFHLDLKPRTIRQIEYTNQGLARTVFAVNNTGTLDIHVESENALSNTLRFEIPASTVNGATPTAQEIPTQTLELIPTQEPTIPATQETIPLPEDDRPGFTDWLIAMLISLGIAWSSYQLSAFIGQIRWGARTAILAFCGGLLAYSYLTLKLPGSEILLSKSIASAVFLSTFSGTMIGLLIGFVWKSIFERMHQPEKEKTSETEPG